MNISTKTILSVSIILLLSTIIGVNIVLYLGIADGYSIHTVNSESMEPTLTKGDVVLIGPYKQIQPDEDIIVYQENGTGPLIIHRVDTYVNIHENWATAANDEYMPQNITCDSINNCPAPHSGYITYGENNFYVDQYARNTSPVKKNWIEGKYIMKVPLL